VNQKIYWTLVLLIAAMTVFRFIGLDVSPPGFFQDESSNAMHFVCLAQTGADATGETFPLFPLQFEEASNRIGGVIPPNFAYAGAVWVSLFGPSITSVRALSAVLMTLTTLGVYLLVRLFFPRPAAILCATAAAISPWMFQLGRISGFPSLEPPLLIFSVYFFLRSRAILDAVLAGAFLSLTLYSYPPARAQLPILLIPLLWMKRIQHGLDRRFLIACLGTALVGSLPLMHHLASPEARIRSDHVAIFGAYYRAWLGDQYSPLLLFRVFLRNFVAHFDPGYLFFTGDRNLRHSTQAVGQLSWLDTAAVLAGGVALLAGLFRRRLAPPKPTAGESLSSNTFFVFCGIGFLSGIVPSALTWEGIPHAVRSIGALPFLPVLTGLTLYRLGQAWNMLYVHGLAAALSVLFAFYFMFHYFRDYPVASRVWWQAPIREAAAQAGRTGDWSHFVAVTRDHAQVSTRYYLVVYGGEDCLSSAARLQQLRAEAG
jgi:4-amino-4-deoxy-L-arabinose transferase-like glycosyltransferase